MTCHDPHMPCAADCCICYGSFRGPACEGHSCVKAQNDLEQFLRYEMEGYHYESYCYYCDYCGCFMVFY